MTATKRMFGLACGLGAALFFAATSVSNAFEGDVLYAKPWQALYGLRRCKAEFLLHRTGLADCRVRCRRGRLVACLGAGAAGSDQLDAHLQLRPRRRGV